MVRGIHTLLNNCLEQAVAERLLLTNPAKGCRLPKLEKREMKILPSARIWLKQNGAGCWRPSIWS